MFLITMKNLYEKCQFKNEVNMNFSGVTIHQYIHVFNFVLSCYLKC